MENQNITAVLTSSKLMFPVVVILDKYNRDWEHSTLLDAGKVLGHYPDSSAIHWGIYA